jgi:glycosyltransferase involved in cell wall biosynthesis
MLAYSFYENDGRVIRYAETLVSEGWIVDAIVLGRHGQPKLEVLGGVHVVRIQRREKTERSRLSYLLRIVRFVFGAMIEITRRHLGVGRYDLVHVHSVPDFAVFSALVPKLTGAKVVLDIHDIVPEFYAAKFGIPESSAIVDLLKLTERLSIAFSDHVIAANELWARRLIARSAAADRCTTFINYPKLSVFRPELRTRRQDDQFLVLYPGSLGWHQGIDVAIRAIKFVHETLPELQFHIYGEGGVRRDLMELISDLSLQDRVRIHDPLPIQEIALVMANADLAIVPKRNDSFGGQAFSTKILEFMAVKVPLVISDTEIDRLYFDDSMVRFFKSGDAHELGRAIIEAARDRAGSKRRVERGRRFVEENCWERKSTEYLALISRLLGGEGEALHAPP